MVLVVAAARCKDSENVVVVRSEWLAFALLLVRWRVERELVNRAARYLACLPWSAVGGAAAAIASCLAQ